MTVPLSDAAIWSPRRMARVRSRQGTRLKAWLRGWAIPPAMWELGSDFVRAKKFKDKSLQPPGHPNPYSEILFPRRVDPVWVSREKIVNNFGQAFSPEQHHFVRYLESGFDALYDFYRIHIPKNVFQALFINETFPGSLPTGVQDFPWLTANLTQAVAPARRSAMFGPISDTELAAEAIRLDSVQRKILKHGFLKGRGAARERPSIEGRVLLHTNGDFRIMITDGNHRVAVLAHHEWKAIPIRVFSWPPIRLSDLEEWPGVVDGRFTPEAARAMFEAYFRQQHEKLLGW